MRLVAGMLAVLLGSSVAAAQDGAPARVEVRVAETASTAPARSKVPVRVVRILPETNQALLYDRSGGGTHLLVTVGEKVGGYTVEAIDDDEVTLSANGQQIVLAAPDRPWRRRNAVESPPGERPQTVRSGAPAPGERPQTARGGEPTPADPYGGPADPYDATSTGAASSGRPGGSAPGGSAPSAGAPGPADPYGDEVREVKAPIWMDPTAPGPRPVPVIATPPSRAPAGAPTTAPAPASKLGPNPFRAPAPAGSPTPAPAPASELAPNPFRAPAPAGSPTPAPAPTSELGPNPFRAPAPAGSPARGAEAVLSRREVDAALADFGAIAAAFRASFTPAGVKVESVLEGSLFAKAGLRAGDVIATVEGRPLRSLDDVAGLYARAGAVRALTAQVIRGGQPLTLRVVIQ